MTKSKPNKAGEAAFLGELISFRNALKLVHWSITGLGSYETHISLDQAIDTLVDVTDRLAEPTIAVSGSRDIVIPETSRPKDYITFVHEFYAHVENARKELFSESFSQSIIDDVQEAIQQLLFRLRRRK